MEPQPRRPRMEVERPRLRVASGRGFVGASQRFHRQREWFGERSGGDDRDSRRRSENRCLRSIPSNNKRTGAALWHTDAPPPSPVAPVVSDGSTVTGVAGVLAEGVRSWFSVATQVKRSAGALTGTVHSMSVKVHQHPCVFQSCKTPLKQVGEAPMVDVQAPSLPDTREVTRLSLAGMRPSPLAVAQVKSETVSASTCPDGHPMAMFPARARGMEEVFPRLSLLMAMVGIGENLHGLEASPVS